MGIEPTHARATIWCVNHFTTPAIILLTRAVGIEPTLKVLETLVLPLNYARKMEGEGFEPPNPKERIYSPPRLASSLPFQNINKWRETESNRRHMELQSIALPTELPSQLLREQDLNLRPSGYEPDELPSCSIPRQYYSSLRRMWDSNPRTLLHA